jgi:hypothetical protein
MKFNQFLVENNTVLFQTEFEKKLKELRTAHVKFLVDQLKKIKDVSDVRDVAGEITYFGGVLIRFKYFGEPSTAELSNSGYSLQVTISPDGDNPQCTNQCKTIRSLETNMKKAYEKGHYDLK